MKNYKSLKNKVGTDKMNSLIQFCNYFQSDDVNLFNEYIASVDAQNLLPVDKLIELYGKRYQLNPERDKEQIKDIFIRNVLEEGYCFHLNSSANYESIMKNGLGLSAIGRKTEERRDYELLKSTLSEDVFRRLQPFHGEKKGSKVYYSNMPMLNASYGQMSEWIMNLRSNFSLVENSLRNNPSHYELVTSIINKYNRKYNNQSKKLFLIPNPLKEKAALIKESSKGADPKIVIKSICDVLREKDAFYTGYIPPETMLSVDLNDYSISYNRDGEIVKYSTESNQNTISV